MKHYNYQQPLQALWQKGVDLYRAGTRGAENFYSETEADWLRDNGITTQEIYDFVEDYASGGEPDFTTFALITDVRRCYFFDQMGGAYTGKTIPPATYPPKTEAVDGIVWLPRIIEKAKAKLRGELDPDTMYCCGGDRRFLKENDIAASHFLRKVAENIDNKQAVIDWVKSRRS